MIKVTYINRQGESALDKYFKSHADALIYLLKDAKRWGYKFESDRITGLLGGLKRPFKSAYTNIIANVYSNGMLKASDCIAFPYEVVYIPEPMECADMYLSELSNLIEEVTK